jgi:predicted amidophosphoribosyltransferase
MACEFLLEEKKSSFNKVCSACGENLSSEQFLICKDCLETKSLDFFKWATEYSNK